jgi:hypothetical protein
MSAAKRFWAALLIVGSLALGAGVVFFLSRPDMIVLTLLCGGFGIFIILESVGRLLGKEKQGW